MSSWRKDAKSIEQRMEAGLENCTVETPDVSHDVIFIFTVAEEKVKISCHKLILSLASPVFEAMFSERHNSPNPSTGMETGDSHTSNSDELANDKNKMSESAKTLEIEIVDVEPIAFKNVIKYVYTRILDMDLKDCLNTMYAAHKYDIAQLVEHCSHLLISQIDKKNVLTYHKAALLLNDKKLEKKSWKFITEDVGELLHSEQLFELSEDDLCKLLTMECMKNVISEVEVFNAILRWGNAQCEMECEDGCVTVKNMREVLKNAIPLIRFPTMGIKYFNHVVEPSQILSERECIKLFKYFVESDEGRASITLAESFNYSCKNRTGRMILSSEIPTDKSSIVKSHACDCFKITGNTGNIKLKAIGIVLPKMNSQQPNVKIHFILYGQKYPNAEWALKLNTRTTKKISKYLQICYVELDNPMIIESDVDYAVCLNADEEGKAIVNPVDLVKYKKESLIRCTTNTNTEKLKLSFVPSACVIWALEFEH